MGAAGDEALAKKIKEKAITLLKKASAIKTQHAHPAICALFQPKSATNGAAA